MLRKMFSLVALVVVAVTFGVGNAAAKPDKPDKGAPTQGFSDGRYARMGGTEGFSDGRV